MGAISTAGLVRYLILSEVLELGRQIMSQSGGALGILNLGGLESALAQPRMTFEGTELNPGIVNKASALGYSLIQNHPVIDGNKRTGHGQWKFFPCSMALKFRLLLASKNR